MKTFFSLFVLFTTIAVNAQTPVAVPTAEEVFQQAYKKAASENKNVLLIFHASWCGWCRKMDAALMDAAVKPLMDKTFVITHLAVYESANNKQFENEGAMEFLTKKGGAEKGLPYWYVLDKEGNVLSDSQIQPGRNAGCPATEDEVAYFISVLKKTSSLTEQELTVVKKRFRLNE